MAPAPVLPPHPLSWPARDRLRAMAPVPSLPRSVAAVLASQMDLPTLLAFRTTSKTSLHVVRQELVATLLLILSRFAPHPRFLAAKLNRLNSVVGGSAALAFFLRDVDVRPQRLDIFVPIDCMPPFFHHLIVDQGGHLVRPRMTSTGKPQPWDFPDEDCFSFRTVLGDINLWQSEAHTPFLPIVAGPTSLHMLYVTPRYFGSAYPSLLFAQRALIARPDAIGFDGAMEEYAQLGIDLRFFTCMWRDLAHHGPCASRYFLCPSQQRTFSDEGSLRARVNPLMDEEMNAEVVWRLDYRPCGARCAEPTPELPVPCLLSNIL